MPCDCVAPTGGISSRSDVLAADHDCKLTAKITLALRDVVK